MKMRLMNCRRERLLGAAIEIANFLSPMDYGESLIAFFKDD
jgi:hypothetical protein